MSATEIDRLVESGRAAYVKGNFKEGFAISTRAIRLIRENPGLLVLNSENTDMVFRAYLVLAMCLNRLGQDQLADSVFQELVLMYPTFPFVQVVQVYYGPTVEEKCRKVFRRLRSMEVGDLTIRVTDEHAMIFVDGQMRGLGSASVTGLLVGTHYVFVRTSTKGLRYEPEVDPNTVTRLEIIPEFDTALKASDEGIGFDFANDTDRGREAVYASDAVRRWHLRGNIAVIGPMKIQGKSAIVGRIYDGSGSVVQAPAYILVEDADSESVRILAQYLVDGTVSEKIHPLGGSSDSSTWVVRPRMELSTSLSKVVLGAGGLTLLAGAAVYAASNPRDFVTPMYDDRKGKAVGAMLVASATIGTGVSLWLRQTRSTSLLPSATLGAAVTVILAGSVLYITDEDEAAPQPGQQVRKYYRDSATHGVIIGSTGLATLGVGLWLMHRERSARPAASRDHTALDRVVVHPLPKVSVASSRVNVDWVGTF
jgi:hypothetical protein